MRIFMDEEYSENENLTPDEIICQAKKNHPIPTKFVCRLGGRSVCVGEIVGGVIKCPVAGDAELTMDDLIGAFGGGIRFDILDGEYYSSYVIFDFFIHGLTLPDDFQERMAT